MQKSHDEYQEARSSSSPKPSEHILRMELEASSQHQGQFQTGGMTPKDPGILCFEHCSDRRVFCFQIPEHCPVCRTDISLDNKLIPFRIPYPFVKALQYPCAIFIKPTNGDFLNEYKLSMDLHIGVTNSRGLTYEYDKDGLSLGRDWTECLLVYQLSPEEEDAVEMWDSVLEQVASLDSWAPSKYNEETFNCYTFVLAFLRCLKYPPLAEAAKTRMVFCEEYVSPRVEVAWKYIKLYRRLIDSGYYVSHVNEKDISITLK